MLTQVCLDCKQIFSLEIAFHRYPTPNADCKKGNFIGFMSLHWWKVLNDSQESIVEGSVSYFQSVE